MLHRWRSALGLCMAAAMVLLGGCSATSTQNEPAGTAAPSVQNEGVADYRIGPGDQLRIFVWNNPDVSAEVPVRPDGLISTPLVEDLLAAGKTPTELARELERRLSEYIRSPQVNVIVQQFRGTISDQIKVVGEAANPRALPYRANMTVLDVMIEVGGLSEFASGNRAKIMRNENGKVREIPVRLKDLMERGRMEANVMMQPGDVVVIPQSIF